MSARRLPLLLVSLSLCIALVMAQAEQCDEIILQMWDDAEDNCSEFERNSACYGLNEIEVDFVNDDDMPEDYFTEPGDQAALSELENIYPVVFDIDVPEWGIALLNIQANIPDSLPGQNVKMFLMGDVDVENGVLPEEAFVSERSITIETALGAAMRYFPRSDSEFLQAVPAGSEVTADAVSTSGGWVRVVYDEIPGWIVRSVLTPRSEAALINLPMISEETNSAMQAFYFTTGIGSARCMDAPSTVLIQGPENFQVDITANGARIRVGSTVMLRTTSEDTLFQLITLVGEAEIFPDTEEMILVPAGQTAENCLSEDRNLGIDDIVDDHEVVECIPPRPLTRTELEELIWVHGIPPELLNYPIPNPLEAYLPEATEEVTEEPGEDEDLLTYVLPPDCQPRSDWTGTYTVQVGDNLTWIGRQYNLTGYELAVGNCIADPDLIIPGQILIVPQPTPVPVAEVATYAPPPAPTPTATPTPTPVDLVVTIAQTNPLPGPMPLEPSTYTITVTNNGPGPATGVTLPHTAPGTLTGAVYTPSVGSYVGGVWTIGTLAAGASVTMTVTGNPNASPGATYTPTATASSVEPDLTPADNTGSTTITVQPIIVNTLNLVGAPGGCTSIDCSLGEALALANILAGADTIGFSVAGTITMAGTAFTLSSNVTINGAGITLDGNAASRIFNVNGGVTATINDMTIQNGSDASINGGGGIFNAGTLTLSNATVTGNTAAFGGGISSTGTLTLTNTTVDNNSGGSAGGGIYMNGGTITGSTIDSNTVTGGGALGGGGIYITGGTVNISGTTISNNSAAGGAIQSGGGIQSSGNLTVTTSAITGNTASLTGGGVGLVSGTATITSTDISGNTAVISFGGGIDLGALAALTAVSVTGSCIDTNTSGVAGSEMNSSNGGFTATATGNWWGVDPPTAAEVTGAVDTTGSVAGPIGGVC